MSHLLGKPVCLDSEALLLDRIQLVADRYRRLKIIQHVVSENKSSELDDLLNEIPTETELEACLDILLHDAIQTSNHPLLHYVLDRYHPKKTEDLFLKAAAANNLIALEAFQTSSKSLNRKALNITILQGHLEAFLRLKDRCNVAASQSVALFNACSARSYQLEMVKALLPLSDAQAQHSRCLIRAIKWPDNHEVVALLYPHSNKDDLYTFVSNPLSEGYRDVVSENLDKVLLGLPLEEQQWWIERSAKHHLKLPFTEQACFQVIFPCTSTNAKLRL